MTLDEGFSDVDPASQEKKLPRQQDACIHEATGDSQDREACVATAERIHDSQPYEGFTSGGVNMIGLSR